MLSLPQLRVQIRLSPITDRMEEEALRPFTGAMETVVREMFEKQGEIKCGHKPAPLDP